MPKASADASHTGANSRGTFAELNVDRSVSVAYDNSQNTCQPSSKLRARLHCGKW